MDLIGAYARQLKQLLPGGALWNLDQESWLSRLFLGVAGELARVDARGGDLVNEWDPRTATETLPEWERILGLAPAGSTAARRAAVVRAYLARGGQTPAYFVELAARLGFVATVTETDPHTWRLDVAPGSYSLTTTEARAGTARAGDRISSRNQTQLEAVINRAKPAHTVALFAYGAQTISFVAAGAFSATGHPAIPTGTAAGDLMVAVCANIGGAPATPSGWTRKVNVANLSVFYRRAASTSETPPVFGMAPSQIATYRGAAPTGDPFEAAGSVGHATADYVTGEVALPDAPGLTTITPRAWVLMAVAAAAEDWLDTGATVDLRRKAAATALTGTAFARAPSASATRVVDVALHHGEKVTAGAVPAQASGSVTVPNEGEYEGAAVLLAIRPAA